MVGSPRPFSTSTQAAEPPGVLITAVTWDGDNSQVTITFDQPCDASGFASGWLNCDGGGQTDTFVSAPDPSSAVFTVTSAFFVGFPWSLNIVPPAIEPGQSGVVS